MLKLSLTNQFKKDLKRITKQNKNLQLLKNVKDLLLNKTTIPPKYKNHNLIGNYTGYCELYIQPDWLLIYKKK